MACNNTHFQKYMISVYVCFQLNKKQLIITFDYIFNIQFKLFTLILMIIIEYKKEEMLKKKKNAFHIFINVQCLYMPIIESICSIHIIPKILILQINNVK